jgi:Na+/citrate or Na+/malate symporter
MNCLVAVLAFLLVIGLGALIALVPDPIPGVDEAFGMVLSFFVATVVGILTGVATKDQNDQIS